MAAMFVMHRVDEAGPDIGGPLTPWHAHTNLCFSPAGTVVGLTFGGLACPAGSVNQKTPEMLHVWVVPNTDGQFAADINAAGLASALS
jgi:hypothetical protein